MINPLQNWIKNEIKLKWDAFHWVDLNFLNRVFMLIFSSFDISRLCVSPNHHMVKFMQKTNSFQFFLKMSKCNLVIKYNTIRLYFVVVVVHEIYKSTFSIMASFFSTLLEEMCHLAFTSYLYVITQILSLPLFLSIFRNGIDSNGFSIMGKYTCASASIHSNNFVFLWVCLPLDEILVLIFAEKMNALARVMFSLSTSYGVRFICFVSYFRISLPNIVYNIILLYYGGWLNTLNCWHIQWVWMRRSREKNVYIFFFFILYAIE